MAGPVQLIDVAQVWHKILRSLVKGKATVKNYPANDKRDFETRFNKPAG